MIQDTTFSIHRLRFDENYHPSDRTRLTTNFANLARGKSRQENLRNVLRMIDNRFNDLAHWDNAKRDRYTLELEIVSVEMDLAFSSKSGSFPLIEVLYTTIVDKNANKRIDGLAGNSFSSYVRDYDFSVLLPAYNKGKAEFSVPHNYGDLHGNLFKSVMNSSAYKKNFKKLPVICLSVSTNRTYHRTENQHPVLGVEYEQREFSLTDQYFKKMGMQVRYFMPRNSAAPLAFYFFGDLLSDYSALELISTISVMESFQKVYRPEIYNANSAAADCYQPSLKHQDYSNTRIVYDREERTQLAISQGHYTDENFIRPYHDILEKWSAGYTA
ncbi:hypothetical protein AA0313_1982 [Acetobacter indonesiensis NRIC 0313]|uniref:DUF1852 domain-containing protein n=1 Tax=Acetobacter indonesiensis TaxID=104101 RepID=A0A252AR97_9PROT|nr:DUF1852 domain-containing protein [Acetobacter indonesiensis]OUI92345.1 hypothetical protein HK17_10445 [Acetobacter indonesiensis]GAN61978.1 hypothetical protein Abin_005_001 [Acetobacter indonesiensis]GBQ59083.1 hypothetical protein AA0313_1982 [Acetobacter indonesiensis NRIC 0313]GEN04759.1 hypothetical protein AIN02nite_27840 [Acetobacter indonesiensis]